MFLRQVPSLLHAWVHVRLLDYREDILAQYPGVNNNTMRAGSAGAWTPPGLPLDSQFDGLTGWSTTPIVLSTL